MYAIDFLDKIRHISPPGKAAHIINKYVGHSTYLYWIFSGAKKSFKGIS